MRKLYLTPDWDGVLWDFEGGPVDLKSLPLSERLRDALIDWCAWHNKIYLDDDLKSDTVAKIDWTLLDVRGIGLWRQVRQELADSCEIVYVSQRFRDYFDDPEQLEGLLRAYASA